MTAVIDGWLSPRAADLTVRLCRLQAALGIRTGVLEQGVYRGKYLALLAASHAGKGLPLVGVDQLIELIGEPVAAEHMPLIVAGIAVSIAGTAPDATPPLIIQAGTQDMDASSLLTHCRGGCSFVSVDAGHEADEVASDMALAASVLSQGGVIALDDAFNSALPSVAEGLFRYFHAADDTKLAPFATCGNKLFLCRPEMHATYLAYAAWLLTQGHEAEYLASSRELDLGNRTFLFIPCLSGSEIVVFCHGAVSTPATQSAG